MAVVRAQRYEAPGSRSFGGETVPLKLFSENLFSEDYSTEVLQTRPDNVARNTSITLEKAFEHAKVHFNHFVKLGNDTEMTTYGLGRFYSLHGAYRMVVATYKAGST